MSNRDEIIGALTATISGEMAIDDQVKFLEKFMPEKISAEDLLVFVEFLRTNMTASLDMPGAIDICGTGGSGLARINTSTIASFILNSLKVKIAKHGNKAASGRFGSFDLLEALGEKIDLETEELEKIYAEKGLAFIFARKFHPAIKHFAEARQKIDKPTVFNLLGPLLNPANPLRQIIGTTFKGQMRLIAETCKLLGKERVMVVSGENGLDEVTLTGKTDVVELRNGEIFEYQISPEDFGIEQCEFEEISGGDAEKNLRIAKEILAGNCKSRHADLVYINCALALKLVDKVATLREGYLLASGDILGAIATTKKLPKSDRSFYEALKKPGLNLIGEIKKASPSEGIIFPGEFNPAGIAELYEESGVSAISVLTDEKYFQGSFEYLDDVRNVTESVPLLCKDFIVSDYQIYKARDFGANAILLIAALLRVEQMQRFLDLARELGMDALCEVHNEEELEKVLLTDAEIIGINNRDLKTFKLDLETTNRLVPLIPEGRIIVSESGINTRADVDKLSPRVNAILVGTSIMKSNNIKGKIYELTKRSTDK